MSLSTLFNYKNLKNKLRIILFSFFLLFIFSTLNAAEKLKNDDAKYAFNIAGLQSQLMETGLLCDARGQYGHFVSKFRTQLRKKDATLDSFFRSLYGKAGAKKRDEYKTELANVQVENGLKSGTIFCQQNLSMFNEVNALSTWEDLANYAEAKNIIQPSNDYQFHQTAPQTKHHHKKKK